MGRGLALLLVVPLLLTGCIGADDVSRDSSEEALIEAQRAAGTGDDAGALVGVVTDVAIQPLEGATITLAELDLSVTSRADGSYRFDAVPAGPVTVTAELGGHEAVELSADIVKDEVTSLDILLTPVAVEEPFSEVYELNGFLDCAQSAYVNTSDAGGARYGLLLRGFCGAAKEIAQQDNNDRSFHLLELQPPLRTLMTRTEWDPNGNAMHESLDITIGVSGAWPAMFVNHEGPGPVLSRSDTAQLEAVDEQLQTNCEEDPESSACGVNPWDNGWPVAFSVWAGYPCIDPHASVCSAYQLEYRHLVQAFYHAEAPVDAEP